MVGHTGRFSLRRFIRAGCWGRRGFWWAASLIVPCFRYWLRCDEKHASESGRRHGRPLPLGHNIRGCTVGGNSKLFKGRKSGGLGSPGGPETLPKGGGASPPTFARVSGAPGAAQTPKMTDWKWPRRGFFRRHVGRKCGYQWISKWLLVSFPAASLPESAQGNHFDTHWYRV